MPHGTAGFCSAHFSHGSLSSISKRPCHSSLSRVGVWVGQSSHLYSYPHQSSPPIHLDGIHGSLSLPLGWDPDLGPMSLLDAATLVWPFVCFESPGNLLPYSLQKDQGLVTPWSEPSGLQSSDLVNVILMPLGCVCCIGEGP